MVLEGSALITLLKADNPDSLAQAEGWLVVEVGRHNRLLGQGLTCNLVSGPVMTFCDGHAAQDATKHDKHFLPKIEVAMPLCRDLLVVSHVPALPVGVHQDS